MIMAAYRQIAIDLIAEAVTAGARLFKACAVLEISVRTLQRWKMSLREKADLADQRKASATNRSPVNKLSIDEREAIVAVCNQPEYQSLPPSQIVPRLADKGEYLASESSFYRVLRDADQVNRRGRSKLPHSVPKPQGFKATGPKQVWSWDITFLASSIRGAFYRLYLVLDVYSRKIVAWEVHENESADHASLMIRKACLAEGIHQDGLVLHADNGGPMKGATMLATLQRLGIVPSFSRPCVSDDNPYSESMFRTLKYVPSYLSKPFESIETARKWVLGFVGWYNDEHRHSAIRYVTPSQRHRGEDRALLRQRDELYKSARRRQPERWSGQTRNWNPVTEVWLNPPREHQTEKVQNSKAA
jgi:transposase InsO family protein